MLSMIVKNHTLQFIGAGLKFWPQNQLFLLGIFGGFYSIPSDKHQFFHGRLLCYLKFKDFQT
jgi:hypothetical protein